MANRNQRPRDLSPSPLEAGEARTSVAATETQKDHPFICNICKRGYSRVDHLARHHRSHTQEKPFSCNVCSKSFARADLLKRHSTSHSHDRGGTRKQNIPPPSPVARVAQACITCAMSKLKCDHRKPCQRCQQKGIICTFPPPNEKNRAGSQRQEQHTNGNQVLDNDTIDDTTMSGVEMERPQLQFADAQDQNSLQSIVPTVFSPSTTQIPSSEQSLAFNEPDMSVPSASLEHQSIDFDDSSLAEFLRDVMMPASPTSLLDSNTLDFMPQPYSSRDVFNFGIDSSLDFDDFDFGWISSQGGKAPGVSFNLLNENSDVALDRGQKTPDVRNGFALGAEAFQNSLWRWAPVQQEHGYAEQINLSLPVKDMGAVESRLAADGLDQRLEQSSRDRVLAMLLSACKPANIPRIVASFPSADLLDSLMHLFFRSELSKSDSWIHLPTFQPQLERPEFIGIVVAAGAVLSSVPTVRKLGFAIQEVVRLALPQIFEDDNTQTRDLKVLQTYALQLSIGLWSGNKRKMEIAESHAQPLITMLRRACHYRRARAPPVVPDIGDDDQTTERKWRCWIEAESFKRLAFHTLIHDAQASISLLVRPLISYAEVSLELPCSQALWRAKDAQTWRANYLTMTIGLSGRLPSLVQCVHDVEPLGKIRDCVDLQMSISIILHAIWSLIAEYRQLEFVLRLQFQGRHWNGGLISTSWHQELNQLLDHFRITVSEWDGGMLPEDIMLQELFMMNLHVSFEELQLFAGKEGNEEAQRIYPLLRQWVDNRKSRQAVWHAGQVVRAAVSFPPDHLRDFHAVALYHASLALWVYGMVSLGTSRSKRAPESSHDTTLDSELIWLDGEETINTHRFISIRRGTPVIRQYLRRGEVGTGFARLDNPKAIMEIIISILHKNCTDSNRMLSPLVENLGQLVLDLGNAARIVGCR